MTEKKNIGVVFGGQSAEHDVSIITAHIPIIDSLISTGKYEVTPVYISKEGVWYSTPDMNKLEYFKSSDFPQKLESLKPVEFSLNNGLTLILPGLFSKRIAIDVVFPAMHGTNGEDGSLMGMLRMANVPFVGCDLSASAVTMDKAFTKQVLMVNDVPIVPFTWFTKHEWTDSRSDILDDCEKLAYPLFVKPVHLGSSIGISKVKNRDELEKAIEVAVHYDDKVLVEEGVHNLIEVTLPMMGNTELQTALIEQPLNQTEFFDFNDKYLSSGKGAGVNTSYSNLPADISEELSGKVTELAYKTYTALGCTGTARIDFLIDAEKNEVYVNEINTLPGSLYHHNWKKAGVSNIALVERLLELAEEHFAEKKSLNTKFTSDILKAVGGAKTTQEK